MITNSQRTNVALSLISPSTMPASLTQAVDVGPSIAAQGLSMPNHRSSRNIRSVSASAISSVLLCAVASGCALPLLGGNDLLNDSKIEITTAAEAESVRNRLVQYIWNSSWSEVLKKQPASLAPGYIPTPDDTLPDKLENLKSITRLGVGSIERVAGGIENVPSVAYILYPNAPDLKRAVIVHHGHGCRLNGVGDRYNLDLMIRTLLKAGYTVAAMRMPLFQNDSGCSGTQQVTHDSLMKEKLTAGSPVKFFMEPVVRVVNFLEKTHPDLKEVDMIGLSGGGWTTTVYPALDPRIIKSFPVAGSLPLYLRSNAADGHSSSIGDSEQFWPPLYSIAGYPDLYILGVTGRPGRLQMQILNLHDDCCFGETQYTKGPPPFQQAVLNYEHEIRDRLGRINEGIFFVHFDPYAVTHQISEQAIHETIVPLLAGAIPLGK